MTFCRKSLITIDIRLPVEKPVICRNHLGIHIAPMGRDSTPEMMTSSVILVMSTAVTAFKDSLILSVLDGLKERKGINNEKKETG